MYNFQTPSEGQIRRQKQPSDGDSVEVFDVISESRHHAFDLMIFAFVQADECVIPIGWNRQDLCRKARSSVG